MCFAAPMALGLISAGVSAMGAQAQASGQANQLAYNSAVAKINADSARAQGVSESERIAEKYRRLAGQQVAAYAKGGVDPNSGSALLVRTSPDRFLDENNAIWNRETEAVGYENKARDLAAQAKNTKSAGNIAAAGSFLSGLAKLPGAGTALQINQS